jgi:hypothetical protein
MSISGGLDLGLVKDMGFLIKRNGSFRQNSAGRNTGRPRPRVSYKIR